MSLINIANLTFAYEGSSENIFTNVSFQIDTDWKLGFCGRNGRGKTTFLRLLMGEYEYSGTISASQRFDYFPYALGDAAGASALDILTVVDPDAELWRLRKELAKLAVDDDCLYRPLGTLSDGERTKVLLAGLFSRGHNFLLIDEPTNHLDAPSREIVAKYLNGKRGFILVSHDRAFLDACVDHVLSINKQDIEVISGNFSVWWEEKRRRDAFETAQNERLSREIDRLRDTAARTADWSDKVEKSKFQRPKSGLKVDKGYVGHKAAKMMRRSIAADKKRAAAIDEKSALRRNIETAPALKISPLAYHSKRLLSLDKVSLFYGEKLACGPLSLELSQGDRLALAGGNGSGKSTALKLLLGENIAHTGNVYIGSQLKISYVPQGASDLAGTPRNYAEAAGIDESLFKALLRQLDFSREQLDQDMGGYSAGQKKKALLAGSMCQKAHLYIWDEPLNYVDIYSRAQIEELLLAYKPTLIFVEHDKAFRDNIATKIVHLGPARQ
jgi:lincosamide and streptogramin A transport system ATP-binding/permease protein